jgi:hypothetical protein
VRSLKWDAECIGNRGLLNQEIFAGNDGSSGFDGYAGAFREKRQPKERRKAA